MAYLEAIFETHFVLQMRASFLGNAEELEMRSLNVKLNKGKKMNEKEERKFFMRTVAISWGFDG